MKKVFYAAHCYEIIKCHLIAKKDRDGRGKYAANSKRDKRRFQIAFPTYEEAQEKVIEYAEKMKSDWHLFW